MTRGVVGSTGPIEIYEVAADGTARCHLRVENANIMYRAAPMAAIAGEEIAG